MTVGDAQGRAGCLHSERRGGIKFLWGVVLGLSESSASFGPGVDSPAELHRVSTAAIYYYVRQHVDSVH